LTVDEVYKLVQFIINKNQQGYLSPDDFNRVMDAGQRLYISYLLGLFQQYTPGRPIARVELGQNSVVRQRLAPVIYKILLTVDGSGNANYPTDYLQPDAMWTSTGFKRIRYVEQDSIDSFVNSAIDPVATNPIYLIENTRFQFYPVTIANANLSYIGQPKNVVWAYRTDGNQRPVYTTGIASVPVIQGGSGYVSATITFAPPASGITATGTVTIQSGVITAIVMTNNGTGYNNTIPVITFTPVGGTGASIGAAVVSVDPVFGNLVP